MDLTKKILIVGALSFVAVVSYLSYNLGYYSGRINIQKKEIQFLHEERIKSTEK